VSWSPTEPKSIMWLLARVSTAKPACLRAVTAAGSVRKRNRLSRNSMPRSVRGLPGCRWPGRHCSVAAGLRQRVVIPETGVGSCAPSGQHDVADGVEHDFLPPLQG